MMTENDDSDAENSLVLLKMSSLSMGMTVQKSGGSNTTYHWNIHESGVIRTKCPLLSQDLSFVLIAKANLYLLSEFVPSRYKKCL